MITIVDALRFRSLEDARQPVSEFQVLVGPNGSGKTTFLEVVTFLSDLLAEGVEGAVLKRTENPRDLTWARRGDRFDIAIETEIPAQLRDRLINTAWSTARYEVSVVVEPDLAIASESLFLFPAAPERADKLPLVMPARTTFEKPPKAKTVVSRTADGSTRFQPETPEGKKSTWLLSFKLGTKKSALDNLPEDESAFPVGTWIKELLKAGVQTVMLNSLLLRRPSPPIRKGREALLSNDGSNLPWVIAELEGGGSETGRYADWVAHVQTAIPDLVGIRTVVREEDRSRYLLVRYRNGIEIPSWLVSDGTLRLLALTLPAYVGTHRGIYLIEEPENGIHPQAVETVFQSLRSVYGAQVFLASHSPVILNLASPNDVLCFSKTPGGATRIVRGNQHPALREWKGETSLGILFASGVLG